MKYNIALTALLLIIFYSCAERVLVSYHLDSLDRINGNYAAAQEQDETN